MDNIRSEDDVSFSNALTPVKLHEYRNLLNAMAALFYTNHRMQDVNVLFYLWKDLAYKKM